MKNGVNSLHICLISFGSVLIVTLLTYTIFILVKKCGENSDSNMEIETVTVSPHYEDIIFQHSIGE